MGVSRRWEELSPYEQEQDLMVLGAFLERVLLRCKALYEADKAAGSQGQERDEEESRQPKEATAG